jgi:ubiquinone biosynthesis protein
VLDFLVSLLILIFAAWLVRRLLGIDRGRWGVTLLAVLAAEACTVVVFRFSGISLTDLPGRALFGVYAIVAVFAMFAIVLVELVARPRGRRRSRGIPHPIRGIRLAAGRTLRYFRVMSIAVRRGLLRTGGDTPEIRGTRLGHALAETFDDAGGLFVKLGQAMAAQPHLVTRAVAAELSRLQDQAAPADPAAARAVLEEELGPVDDVFAEIRSDPLGSASIAQTYRARLKDGREVVVKVQRPGVRQSIEQDLDILARLADRLDRRTTWAPAIGLRELVGGFAQSTREELDFRIEAANSTAAHRSLQDADPVRVPEMLEEFTTERVLVEELVEGRSVGAAGALDGIEPDGRRALADGLLALTLRQMLAGEPFHADPHPGNVFLRTDGRLALIDFGAVGRLNRYERSGLVDIMRGLQTEDPTLLRDAALRIGTHSRRIDEEALDRELARLLAMATRPDGTLNPDVFGNALFVFRDFGILLPRSTTTLFRTLVTLLGTLQVLSPGYDLAEAARRLGGTPEGQQAAPKTLEELVLQEAINAGPALARLPREMDELARSLLRGDLRTRVSLLSEPEDVRVARGLVNRMVTGLVGSAMALSSAILLTSGSARGAGLVSGVGLVSVLGGIGLFFSLLLLLRLVVQILRERD